jgi:hypothetical protein
MGTLGHLGLLGRSSRTSFLGGHYPSRLAEILRSKFYGPLLCAQICPTSNGKDYSETSLSKCGAERSEIWEYNRGQLCS